MNGSAGTPTGCAGGERVVEDELPRSLIGLSRPAAVQKAAQRPVGLALVVHPESVSEALGPATQGRSALNAGPVREVTYR